MKYRFSIICLSMLLFFTGCTYPSIDEAIQSKWKYPIKVLYVDEKKNTVIFSDQDQYIFNTFEKINNRYSYSTEGEDGFRLTGKSGPFFLRVLNREEVGNVVWGVLKIDKKVVTIEVTFTNKNNPNNQVKLTIPVENNVFIGYPKQNFFESEESLYNEWKVSAKAFDEKKNIVAVTDLYY